MEDKFRRGGGIMSAMKVYEVFGQYTYKVVQKVKAENKDDAIEIAQAYPLCEWDCVERNSYCEKVNYVKEVNDGHN